MDAARVGCAISRRQASAVKVDETTNLHAVRTRLGVPSDLAACHTAEVSGYVLEGHVPAAAVRQLLEKRPSAVGLSVPGMPVGSPGMEGGAPEKYEVILFLGPLAVKHLCASWVGMSLVEAVPLTIFQVTPSHGRSWSAVVANL